MLPPKSSTSMTSAEGKIGNTPGSSTRPKQSRQCLKIPEGEKSKVSPEGFNVNETTP